MNESTLLDIKGLDVAYHSGGKVVHAVNDLNLSLGQGETLGLVGETGAGKTTTALSVLGILPEVSVRILRGEILYKGENLLEKSEKEMRQIRGKEVAMIFQDPMTSLDPVMTVGAQIEEMMKLHSSAQSTDTAQGALRMLERVGIKAERFNDYPHQFSGGMKQRVMIAIALSCNPSLLIADEPTTALDVTIQAQVLELMKELKNQYKMSLIMISHDLGIIAEICDRVAIMYAGNIVEQGSAEMIYQDHRHPYTEALFNSLPLIDSEQEELKVIAGAPPDPTQLPQGCPFFPRCPYADARCSEEKPQNIECSPGHFVRCFHARAYGEKG